MRAGGGSQPVAHDRHWQRQRIQGDDGNGDDAHTASILDRRVAALPGRGIHRSGRRAAAADASVNPTAQSVKEQELLKELQKIQGRSSLPDARTGVLEQPAGRDWRQFHQVTLRWIGAIAILGMLARADPVLSDPRHGAHRSRAVRPHAGALQCVRALRALDDGELLHRARPVGPQHHLRQGAADAAHRAGGVRELVAVGQVRAQLPELPLHARRRADVPDVDRLEFPVRRRLSGGSAKAAASSATSIRRRGASMPARKSSTGWWCWAAAQPPSPAIC